MPRHLLDKYQDLLYNSRNTSQERISGMNKKRILSFMALCLCLVMMLQFAACTNEGTEQEQTTEDQTDTQTPESDTQPSDTGNGSENTTDDQTNPPSTENELAAKPSINFDQTVQISQNGQAAEVTAAGGLKYTASGYSKLENNSFTIRTGFKVELGDQFSAAFNRLTLCFVSSQPLNCTVTYTQDGKTVEDLYYLEAGKQTFCALIKGYLSGKQATQLNSITFDTCEETDATFVLCDVKTEMYQVYSDEVYYLQNDSYKLGVRLSWGGGICYLQDLNKKINGVENLINQADTGRLVQQSYYGTHGNGEYVDGDYNGVRWPYNPVQGGDVHGNPSRIIDIVVGKHSLYIKAQPQDWGHDGDLTISYMENLYILEEDHIRVDNRFVDFSGWEHRYANQELPAFYTLSFFGDFTYYAGSKPWQDEELTTKKNLEFWGDAAYHDDCTFKLRYSNTETWCAWTNRYANYGIGLFVPGTDVFLAGRHAYNGSKDSLNGATNYVAPLCTMKIVSYEPIEYSYMMTTGSLEKIRSVFKENKDFTTNESLHLNYISDRLEDEGSAIKMDLLQFAEKSSTLKLTPTSNTTVGFSEEQKAAMLTIAAASDPHVTIDYTKSDPKLKAEDYSVIKITYMIPTTNSRSFYTAELFLSTGTSMGAEGGKSVRTELVADGEYHTVEVNVSGLNFWSGNVNAIRFDYFDACAEGDVVYVQAIELGN